MKINTMFKQCLCVAVLALGSTLSHAAIFGFHANLSGANEAPPNASPGTGFVNVSLDTMAHTLQIDISFSGLLGTTTASHIHCCTAVPFTANVGVSTALPSFVGFPDGVTRGTHNSVYDTTLNSSFSAAFIANNGGTALGAETALLNGMNAGRAYLNIHTTAFAGGEIRGFLTPVPEPETYAMLLAGLGLLGFAARRRKVAAA